MQVLYLGRASHTKETLPNFLKWRRVTRHPLVFCGLTGSQRTPRVWGVTDHRLYVKFSNVKFSKWEFLLIEAKFLGHVVLASNVFVDLEKVEAIMRWVRPKSVFEIRRFLGLAGYYRRFIEDFSRLATPMTRLS